MPSNQKNSKSSSEEAIFNQHERREKIAQKTAESDKAENRARRGLHELVKTLYYQGFKRLKKKSNKMFIVMSRKIPDKRMDYLILELGAPSLTMTSILSSVEKIAILQRKKKKMFGGEKQIWKPQENEVNIQYVVTVEGPTYEGLWARAEESLKIKIGKEKGVILPPSRVKEAMKSLSSSLYGDVLDFSMMEIASSNDVEASLEFLVRVGGEDRESVAEKLLRMLNIKIDRKSDGVLTIKRAIDKAREKGVKEKAMLTIAQKMVKENPRCNRKAA